MQNLAESLEPPVSPEEIAAAEKPEVPETKAEAKPEAKPEAKAEDDKKQTLVPHAALHEERQKRKELDAQLRAERDERQRNEAVLADRLQQLYQAAQPQRQAPQYRDPNTDPDPLVAMQHNQNLLAQQVYESQRQQQEQAQRSAYIAQQQEGARRLANWAKTQADAYTKENPDFPEAYQHIRNVRAAELAEMGWEGEELINQLYTEELNVFHMARQRGKNPAEVAFNMAKAAGWKKQEKQGEQKMEALQKGTEAAKSLGQGQEPGTLTLEQLANMSEDEFAAEKEKLRKQGKRISDVV